MAEKRKKKIRGLPKIAAEGRFRLLSTTEMIKRRSAKNEIFDFGCIFLPFFKRLHPNLIQ